MLYLVVGLYLVNLTPLGFVPMPEVVSQFNDWIILLGAALIIIDSFGFLRKKLQS